MSNKDFTDLYKNYNKNIFIFIHKNIRDTMLVEDLVQETFAKAWKAIDTYKVDMTMTTWLHTIAKNVIIDHFRKGYADKYILVSQFATEDNETGDKIYEFADTSVNDNQVEAKELRTEIHKAVKALKPKYRFIAKLYFMKQMSYNEIGEFFDMPEGSVKGMIFRVREMLQTSLREYAYS
jgi:RNA polymerase sigma-70 factor (ECF subfamily)